MLLTYIAVVVVVVMNIVVGPKHSQKYPPTAQLGFFVQSGPSQIVFGSERIIFGAIRNAFCSIPT